MPWEITIVPIVDGETLGECDEIIALLAERVPELDVERGPSILEQIESFPDHPMRSLVEGRTPEELDAAGWSHPETAVSFETPELSVDFSGFRPGRLPQLLAEVRGTGDLLPLLRRLVANSPWSVMSAADKSIVDLSADRIPQWDAFCRFRDEAFGEESD